VTHHDNAEDKVAQLIAPYTRMTDGDFTDKKVTALLRDFTPASADDPGREGTAIILTLLILGIALIVVLVYLLRVVL
jgi:hypothetical protein